MAGSPQRQSLYFSLFPFTKGRRDLWPGGGRALPTASAALVKNSMPERSKVREGSRGKPGLGGRSPPPQGQIWSQAGLLYEAAWRGTAWEGPHERGCCRWVMP